MGNCVAVNIPGRSRRKSFSRKRRRTATSTTTTTVVNGGSDVHEQFKNLKNKMKTLESSIQNAETKLAKMQASPALSSSSFNMDSDLSTISRIPSRYGLKARVSFEGTTSTNNNNDNDYVVESRIKNMCDSMHYLKRDIQKSMDEYVNTVATFVSEQREKDFPKLQQNMLIQIEKIDKWKSQFEEEMKKIQTMVQSQSTPSEIIITSATESNNGSSPGDAAEVRSASSPDMFLGMIDDLVKYSDTPLTPMDRENFESADNRACLSPDERRVFAELPAKRPLKREMVLRLVSSQPKSSNEYTNFEDLLEFVANGASSSTAIQVIIEEGIYKLEYNNFFRSQSTRIHFTSEFTAKEKLPIIELGSNWKIDSWTNLTFSNLQFNGEYQYKLFVKRSAPSFYNCILNNCRLDINFCRDVVIENCIVKGQDSKPGVKLFKSAGAFITKNYITECCNGVELNTSIDVSLIGNEITSCLESGLYLYVSTVKITKENSFSENKKGVTVATRSGGNFIRNQFFENVIAIKLHDRESHSLTDFKDNHFIGNKIISNSRIVLESTSDLM